jgi:hypothetical protein
MIVKLKLETSDFTVEQLAEGRVGVFISGDGDYIELDLHPGVAQDLMLALLEPETP